MGIINLLFKAILISSVMGSFVTIIILLMKKLFKNKLSAAWQYYIWILLILRLALPYSYQSPLSIFNIFTNTFSNVEVSLSGVSIKDPKIAQMDADKNNVIIPDKTDTNKNMSLTVSEPNIKNTKTDKFDLYNIASIIWFIGMLSIILFIFTFNMIFKYRLRNQQVCNDKETLDILNLCKKITNLKGYIPIIYAENLNGVSLCGIFKPHILISNKITNNFSLEQKKYVFMHELIHLKYKDILINWIMIILTAFNWFNPIIWYSFYKMQQDCELACDEKVLKYLEPICYNNYSSTIINMAAIFSKSHNVFNSTALVSDKSNLKRRIGMINSFKSKSFKWSILGVTLIVLIGVVCLVNPKAAASPTNNSTIKTTQDSKGSEQMDNTIVIPNDAQTYLSSKEITDQNLFITEEIKNIYDNYSKNKNDEILRGLNPIDILRLFNKAVEDNNLEMQVSLMELPEYITQEQFIQEIKNDQVSQENGKKLLERFHDFKGKIIERIVDSKKAYIIIEKNGWFRMEKDRNGIWKLGWMARA